MKTIAIIRHAKSSWTNANLRDHDRPLNARGERDAPIMAKHLLNNEYQINKIVTSTAKRAEQTAKSFADLHQVTSDNFYTSPNLYHAGIGDWITVLEEYWHLVDDSQESLIAFYAHNPGITNIINWLCDENLFNVPTCGCAIIGFQDDLERIDSGVAQLIHYFYPKGI